MARWSRTAPKAVKPALEDACLGRRFFRRLSDAELFHWRPTTPRGGWGWSSPGDQTNVSAANREMRRRAQIAGLATPYEWLTKVQDNMP